MADMTNKAALRNAEAAVYIGIAPSTLNKLRLTGGGPRYRKIGRRVVYPITELDAWLAEQLRSSTSEVTGE